MHLRRRGLPIVLALAACSAEQAASPRAPEVVLVNPQVWNVEPVRLVSRDFPADTLPEILLDDSLVPASAIQRLSLDTVAVYKGLFSVERSPWHTIVVRTAGGESPPMRFEIHGPTRWAWTAASLVGRPVALGHGSSKFMVGTAAGLAILDAATPDAAPRLVDSTVDPACLYAIGTSSDGAVVSADRGCGTLRARLYGATTVDVDSGPPATGWRYALDHPPGTWLLASDTAVAVAVRTAGGGWSWSRWSAPCAYLANVVPSPDGHLAAVSYCGFGTGLAGTTLVFDLEHGTFLHQFTHLYPAATFSPSGDTLVYATGPPDSLVLLASRSGARLAAFGGYPTGRFLYFGAPGGLAYDSYGPWLYVLAGCTDWAVVDRRTWGLVGRNENCGEYLTLEEVLAVSGFEALGWVLSPQSIWSNPGKVLVEQFTIPGP